MANEERLRAVVKAMEEGEQIRAYQPEGSGFPEWVQSTWCAFEDTHDPAQPPPICQTAFCFAGWAVWVENGRTMEGLLIWNKPISGAPGFWDEDPDLHWADRAQAYLELNSVEAERLFSASAGYGYFDPEGNPWHPIRSVGRFKQYITQVTGVTFPEGEAHASQSSEHGQAGDAGE